MDESKGTAHTTALRSFVELSNHAFISSEIGWISTYEALRIIRGQISQEVLDIMKAYLPPELRGSQVQDIQKAAENFLSDTGLEMVNDSLMFTTTGMFARIVEAFEIYIKDIIYIYFSQNPQSMKSNIASKIEAKIFEEGKYVVDSLGKPQIPIAATVEEYTRRLSRSNGYSKIVDLAEEIFSIDSSIESW